MQPNIGYLIISPGFLLLTTFCKKNRRKSEWKNTALIDFDISYVKNKMVRSKFKIHLLFLSWRRAKKKTKNPEFFVLFFCNYLKRIVRVFVHFLLCEWGKMFKTFFSVKDIVIITEIKSMLSCYDLWVGGYWERKSRLKSKMLVLVEDQQQLSSATGPPWQ